MLTTISRIDTPLRLFGGATGNAETGGVLGLTARTAANVALSLSRAEFLFGMDPYERQWREEWAEQLTANRQWMQRVLDPGLSPSAGELTKTVKAVFAVLSRFGPEAINFAQLTDHINGVHLAVVLRSTADELKHTGAWQDALALVQTVLIRDGIDPQDALMGMIPRE